MITTFVTIPEVSRATGIDQALIVTWIEREWLVLSAPAQLDKEDIARVQIIQEMINDFGVNEEAIPVILHLMDQVCYFREQIQRASR